LSQVLSLAGLQFIVSARGALGKSLSYLVTVPRVTVRRLVCPMNLISRKVDNLANLDCICWGWSLKLLVPGGMYRSHATSSSSIMYWAWCGFWN